MPREGHKFSSWSIRSLSTHFNPRAPRGARPPLKNVFTSTDSFQSTCPARGTTQSTDLLNQFISDFNPRAPRGARLDLRMPTTRAHNFNPRAPRGARHVAVSGLFMVCPISIHVPREGHDPGLYLENASVKEFQSTCPARGTTYRVLNRDSLARNFNPRAPRGARPFSGVIFAANLLFQSTGPAWGTTIYAVFALAIVMLFQSTCPARGTTL